MAETRPYSDFAYDYVERNAAEIHRIAAILNVDPLAVAGSIGEEISDSWYGPNVLRTLTTNVAGALAGELEIDAGIFDNMGVGAGNVHIGRLR